MAASAIPQGPRGNLPIQSFDRSLLSASPVKPTAASTATQSWRWLGALRRSLSYGSDEYDGKTEVEWDADGTTARHVGDSKSNSLLSEEDRQALDAVFKRPGSAKEAERMRSVLAELADRLESCREREKAALRGQRDGSSFSSSSEEKKESSSSSHPSPTANVDAERMVTLLLDVRGFCQNRPSFSAAFVAMGGLDVLLGCASERGAVPRDVRGTCFLLLTALSYHDLPIQLRLLNEGAVRVMASLYFDEFPAASDDEEEEGRGRDGCGATAAPEPDDDGAVRGRIIQAIDAAVCEHAVAEGRFCSSERGRRVVEAGLGVVVATAGAGAGTARNALPDRPWEAPPEDPTGGRADEKPPATLRKKCLSLLRELITSRFTSRERVESFSEALRHVATKMTLPEYEDDERVRELALGLIVKVLRQEKKGASVIKGFKGELGALGERRVQEIQSMDAVEREVSGDNERDLWFRIAKELGK